MGLGAYVNCACYRRGRTHPFPIPDFEPYFKFDADGVLGLDLPYEGYEYEHDSIQTWMQSACHHEDMELVSEQLANWTGYLAFLQSLSQIGWKYFPTLRQELPRANDGHTLAGYALRMLHELEIFSKLVRYTQNAFLVNTLTGNVIQEYIAAMKGVFVFNKRRGYRMGVDPQGFFIQQSADEEVEEWGEVFRANRFEQRIVKRDETGKPRQVEFYCAETEARFNTDLALIQYEMMGAGQLLMPHYPGAMHLEIRQMDVHHYDYILKPLRKICHASVCSGNPIVWF